LRDALWSIYFHSTFRNGLKPPALVRDRSLDPQALLPAIETLTEHDNVLRRARALRKLVAGRLHDRERLNAVVDSREATAIRQAVEALGATLAVDLKALDAVSGPEAITRLDEWQRTSAALGGPCKLTGAKAVSCHDGRTLNTTVTGEVLVNRTPDELVAFVDPRQWDECHACLVPRYLPHAGAGSQRRRSVAHAP
jgi:hypothetical protein